MLGRLAKRGLPASVAAGATILGAAGGNASVPHRLCAKVLSQAAAPDQMSPIIVSLARGVTHVYATRLKILVAAVLLAGALTTGLGVRLLSSADAQAPPAKPDQSEQLRRALELLAQAQPKERWEYKFVPAANPLSIGDVLTYLKKYDAEGWEYCGAQDLLSSDKLKEVPKSPTSTYLVFKRPKAADNRRAELTAEALLKVDEQKMLEMKRLYDVQLRQALDQFKKSEVDARDQEAKARKQAVSAELATRAERDRALVVREQALAAEHAARAERENAARLAQVDAARQKELVAKTAQLEAELAKTRAMAEQLAKQLNDLKDQGKTTAGAGKDTLTVKLTGMDGNTAAALLSKKMPAQKIVAETWPDSIRLIGPANVLEQAREILAAEDKARKAPAKRDTKVEDDELTVFHLKSAAAEEMAKKLQELFKGTDVRVVVDAKTNSLLVAGPPKIVADIKALVSELDREKK